MSLFTKGDVLNVLLVDNLSMNVSSLMFAKNTIKIKILMHLFSLLQSLSKISFLRRLEINITTFIINPMVVLLNLLREVCSGYFLQSLFFLLCEVCICLSIVCFGMILPPNSWEDYSKLDASWNHKDAFLYSGFGFCPFKQIGSRFSEEFL